MSSHLHVPAVGLDVGVGPHKEVEDGEHYGQEGDREHVDSDREEAADLLLVVEGLDVLDELLVLLLLPGKTYSQQ